MSTPTPIEIVRAVLDMRQKLYPGHEPELYAALTSVLADAERLQTAKQYIAKLLDEDRIGWLEQQREEECEQKVAALNESEVCLKETKQLREQNARLRAALESLQSDAQCTIDLYNKIGPTWTSRDSGAEYYDASYVIGSAEERIATIKAALNGEEASK